MSAEEHWANVRAELHAKREALRAQGYVVCSHELYFPPGTKLGWKNTEKTLADYSDTQLEDELRQRRERRQQEVVESSEGPAALDPDISGTKPIPKRHHHGNLPGATVNSRPYPNQLAPRRRQK